MLATLAGYLHPTTHPVGTRLLLARRKLCPVTSPPGSWNAHVDTEWVEQPALIEVVVVEWTPSDNYVCLQQFAGSVVWVSTTEVSVKAILPSRV